MLSPRLSRQRAPIKLGSRCRHARASAGPSLPRPLVLAPFSLSPRSRLRCALASDVPHSASLLLSRLSAVRRAHCAAAPSLLWSLPLFRRERATSPPRLHLSHRALVAGRRSFLQWPLPHSHNQSADPPLSLLCIRSAPLPCSQLIAAMHTKKSLQPGCVIASSSWLGSTPTAQFPCARCLILVSVPRMLQGTSPVLTNTTSISVFFSPVFLLANPRLHVMCVVVLKILNRTGRRQLETR